MLSQLLIGPLNKYNFYVTVVHKRNASSLEKNCFVPIMDSFRHLSQCTFKNLSNYCSQPTIKVYAVLHDFGQTLVFWSRSGHKVAYVAGAIWYAIARDN